MANNSTNTFDSSEIKDETVSVKVTEESEAAEDATTQDSAETRETDTELKAEIEDVKSKSENVTTVGQTAEFNPEAEAGDENEKVKAAEWMSKMEAKELKVERKGARLKAAELAVAEEALALRAKMEADDLRTRKKIALQNAIKEERHVHDIIGGGTRVMHLLRQFTFRYPTSWPVRRVIAAAEDDAASIEADTATIEALATVGLGIPDINLLKELVSDSEPMDTTLENVYQTVRWQWIRDLAGMRDKNIKPGDDPDAPELQTKYKSDILEILTESGSPEIYFQHILTELQKKVPGATAAQVRLHAFRSLLLMSQDGTVTINQSLDDADTNFMVKHNV